MKKLALLALVILSAACSKEQSGNNVTSFQNDSLLLDSQGLPVLAQGGSIANFEDPRDGKTKYFWYGAHYAEADSFILNPSRKYLSHTLLGVNLYTSADLASWQFEGEVLPSSLYAGSSVPTGAIGVCYFSDAQKYALLAVQDSALHIFTSASPFGPFEKSRVVKHTASGNAFAEAYVYADGGRNFLTYTDFDGFTNIAELLIAGNGDITYAEPYEAYDRKGYTGRSLFKVYGFYFIGASAESGFQPSELYFLMSDSLPYGTYYGDGLKMKLLRGSAKGQARLSRTGFFFDVQGENAPLTIYCGDRWNQHTGLDGSLYQWQPITLDPEDEPLFNSLSHWELESKTGVWRVGKYNNYAVNGSFEAEGASDKDIPAWKVFNGTQFVSIINNDPNDRSATDGNKSLAIKMSRYGEVRLSQTVYSTRNYTLIDGPYTISAKVKVSGQFSKLVLFVLQNNEIVEFPIDTQNSEWQTISVPIEVIGSQQNIGFYATGHKGATCLIDDVSLRRNISD